MGTCFEDINSIITLDPEILIRHTAVLGSPGSGKTVLACNLVEQILARGIPVILVDRKGDLCSYLKDSSWNTLLENRDDELRRSSLRDSVRMALYTPGHLTGRPLSIPALPEGLNELPPGDKEPHAKFAAESLVEMMEYKHGQTFNESVAILIKGILLLNEKNNGKGLTIKSLTNMIYEEDPDLVSHVPYYSSKDFKKLAKALSTLQITKKKLLSEEGEKINITNMFDNTEKTPLTIISTKFLAEGRDLLFWVSQFLTNVSRFASKHPSNHLQGILMFDEADIYVPATSKPPTKGPMENLLKRARSAGIGLILATQSPGDFDYKCRGNITTWFIGKVTQKTDIEKMKGVLNDTNVDGTKLASQGAGNFFMAQEGKVQEIMSNMSLIKPEQLSEEEIESLAQK